MVPCDPVFAKPRMSAFCKFQHLWIEGMLKLMSFVIIHKTGLWNSKVMCPISPPSPPAPFPPP